MKNLGNEEDFEVLQIAYDPYLANHTVVQECQRSEHEGLLVSFGQTISNLSYPTKKVEEVCHSVGSSNDVQCFEHFNHPVLKWMMANAQIIRDHNENIRLTKKDPKKKVDGIAALINAMASYLSFDDQEEGRIEFIPDVG